MMCYCRSNFNDECLAWQSLHCSLLCRTLYSEVSLLRELPDFQKLCSHNFCNCTTTTEIFNLGGLCSLLIRFFHQVNICARNIINMQVVCRGFVQLCAKNVRISRVKIVLKHSVYENTNQFLLPQFVFNFPLSLSVYTHNFIVDLSRFSLDAH